MSNTQLFAMWQNLGGDNFGSISTSGPELYIREIWINFDTARMSQLTDDQVVIIWKYFNSVRKIYPNANMTILEVDKNDDAESDTDDECENNTDCILIVTTPNNEYFF